MEYHFCKYQGTGNDFIIFDVKKHPVRLNSEQIKKICDRRFGIGADGVILLESADKFDFRMVYYNADGNEGSMCGNGGRCIVQYAFQQQYIKNETIFDAADGTHKAIVNGTDTQIVSLLMKDVTSLEMNEDFVFLDTGSPHYIKFVSNADEVDVVKEGREIRYNNRFSKTGANVNFVEVRNEGLYIRTYERGVEDETLSCGTGVTASVLAAVSAGKIKNKTSVNVKTPGGMLKVEYKSKGQGYTDIFLIGPAVCVFEGEINL